MLLVAACGGSESGSGGGDVTPPPPPKTVSAIELSSDSLFFGGLSLTRSITATGRASDGSVVSGATFSWSSTTPSVATVSSAGAVTAVAPGETEIRVSSGSGSASAKVVVLQVAAGVNVSPSALTFGGLGETAELTVAVVDSGNVAIPDAEEILVYLEDTGVAAMVGLRTVEARGPGSTRAVAVAVSGGLSGGADVAVTIPDVAGVVGAEGGTVQVEGGAAVLDLPAGALSTETAITARASDPDGGIAGTGFEFGPDVEFDQPAELVIAYDEAEIGEASELSLGLYRNTGGSWQEVEGIRPDPETNRVRGMVRATGRYAVRAGWLRNPTGLWRVEETVLTDSCFQEAGLVETINVWAEFNGTAFTVERDGISVSGTLDGDEFGWTTSYESEDFPGVTVGETYRIRLDLGGETASGTGRLIGSGAVNCQITTSLTAEKIGDQKPLGTDVDRLDLRLDFGSSPIRPGRRVTVNVRAFDSVLEVFGATVDLQIEERGLFAPGTPTRIQAFTDVDLEVAYAGTTRIRAFVINDEGRLITTDWVTLTFEAEPTAIEVIGPPAFTTQPDGLTLLEGKEFELEPDLVFLDDNPTVVRWDLVFADGARYPVGRSCRSGSRCADNLTMVWDHVDPEAIQPPGAQLEGYNHFDALVSSGFVVFRAQPNTIQFLSFNGTLGTPGAYWPQVGFSGDPAVSFGTQQNSAWNYCRNRDESLCLHGYRIGNSVGLSDGRGEPGLFDRTIRVTLPSSLIDVGDENGWIDQGTGLVFSVWSCRADQMPPDPTPISISISADGQVWDTPKGTVFLAEPCGGSMSVQVDDYVDVRGRWRRFTVNAEGTWSTGGTAHDVAQGGVTAVFSVKWAPGETEPLWDRTAEPTSGGGGG